MEDVHKFGTSIKMKYRERRINCEKQWPPCHSNKLVRLELIEREKREGYSANTQRGREEEGVKRTPLAYDALFKVDSGTEESIRKIRKVLVEGDAGIGKTTLCISVSEDWANGKLFQQFELVFHLPLRMKVAASAGSLPELLKLLHPSPRLCESVARHLEEEEGKSVLIIADGWDELGESERQEGSFLYQLLFQEFPLVSVVVTSRPSASAPLRQLPCIDRFVEVRGFNKEHIIKYIKSEFVSDQEKAGRLLVRLADNPLVESVCSVPLNCAIICHLWHTLEEALPSTMTELYTEIILKLVLRNIRKIGTYNAVLSLTKFDSLPTDLQQPWWLLCEFAFQALEKDQLVFSQEELAEFFPEGLALDKEILCFGLLQSAESIGFGTSFHFLHLTFQEFLAALHIARQPPDKQLQVFQSHELSHPLNFSPNHFEMVLRFFFGIHGFNTDSSSFIQKVIKCVVGVSSYYSFLRPVSLSHCAFEAHSHLINTEIDYLINKLSFHGHFGYPRTAHDCTAVLYFIANMQRCDRMEINFDNCGVRENQIIKLMDILASKERKLQIIKLSLVGSRLTVSGLQALQSAVLGDLLAKLESLNLKGSLTSDADTNATWLTGFVDALLAHCPHVKRLDVSNNNLGVPGACAISRIGDYSTCGEPRGHRHKLPNALYLNRTNLGDEGVTILIKSLKEVSEVSGLSGLGLAGNDIHATGVSCLADAVGSGKIKLSEIEVYILDLSDNPLGLEGTVAISRMLGSNDCRFWKVDLSRCGLTTAGGSLPNTESLNVGNTVPGEVVRYVGQQLCQMPQNCYITSLSLDDNSFTGEGIHILAGFMHLCPHLNYFLTNNCDITSDDLIWLLDKLTRFKSSSPSLCSELGSWNLHNNQIDDSGVSALIDHLPSLFSCLYSIGIFNNPVSIHSEVKKRLEEKLRRRHEERLKLFFAEEQKQARSSLLLASPSAVSHQVTRPTKSPVSRLVSPPPPLPFSLINDQVTRQTPSPESASGDSIEGVVGIRTSSPPPPPSLSPATLPLSNAEQCAEQPDDHQLQQGSRSETVQKSVLDLRPPPSKRHK